MPSEPQIKMMSHRRRNTLFKSLLVIFALALPFFIFYTTGYRISFEDEGTKVVTTGGVYVTTDELEVDVYLNEEIVERPRLFRNAYYIQNIEAGKHKIVVQGEGLQTWVKELPVDPYIVTEVSAFNMPEEVLVRPIAEYTTTEEVPVFFAKSTSTEIFPQASTTTSYLISTTTATSSYLVSSEFVYVADLFATTTATSTDESLISRLGREIQFFEIASTTEDGKATSSVIFPYVERGNMRIVDREEDLFAVWAGPGNSVPHYFCVTGTASSSIATRYGQHVAEQVESQKLSLTDPLLIDGARFCRTEIRLDRKWQDVSYYNFFPGTSDLVLLQLQDGLYVTEVDDRAWQNTQKVYNGDEFEVIATDDNIYIKENGLYMELITAVEE